MRCIIPFLRYRYRYRCFHFKIFFGLLSVAKTVLVLRVPFFFFLFFFTGPRTTFLPQKQYSGVADVSGGYPVGTFCLVDGPPTGYTYFDVRLCSVKKKNKKNRGCEDGNGNIYETNGSCCFRLVFYIPSGASRLGGTGRVLLFYNDNNYYIFFFSVKKLFLPEYFIWILYTLLLLFPVAHFVRSVL